MCAHAEDKRRVIPTVPPSRSCVCQGIPYQASHHRSRGHDVGHLRQLAAQCLLLSRVSGRGNGH